jgi:predicted nucleic acid-binding protein
MNAAKPFFDTNIFVYMWDEGDHAKAFTAERLLRDAIAGQTGVISTQVVQEFFQVAFRLRPGAMTDEEAQQFLWRYFGAFHCVQPSLPMIQEALLLHARYKLAWYDSLVVAAALQAECSVLYSEDFQDGQVFEGALTVVNPFAAGKN